MLVSQVAVDEKFSESLALIDLFGFHGEKTTSSSTYMGEFRGTNGNIFERVNGGLFRAL